MKLARVRFTVRRMMVAVAVAALGLTALSFWARRDERYLKFALGAMTHAGLAEAHRTGGPYGRVPVNPRKAAYHAALVRKYEWAIRYLWLPVLPDPPEPE
jgi:hypothetical protein